MKTRQTGAVAEVFGAAETKTLSIAANAKAFKELISGIYSDKAFAITRELFANAWDAQREAGNEDKPFEVSAPTILEPSFSVRDFGISMTHETVMGLYSQLFMSTKDAEDDDTANNYTGKFGLGSKTPFAYTDAFQLTTFLNGTMRAYDIYMNAGQPTIALFLEQETDEPNGVKVSFPVEVSDHKDFLRAIEQATLGLDVKPIIKNAKLNLESEGEIVMEGACWKMYPPANYYSREARTSLRVRQGTVLYPLNNKDAIPNLPAHLHYLFDLNIKIDVKIGELEVSTSREALSYDDYTCTNLIVYLEELHNELVNRLTAEINAAKTYYEFCRIYLDLSKKMDTRLFDNIVKGIRFRGRKYSSVVAFTDDWRKEDAVNEEGITKTDVFGKAVRNNVFRNQAEFCVYSNGDMQMLTSMYFRKGRGESSSAGHKNKRYYTSFQITSGQPVIFVIENNDAKVYRSAAKFRKIAKQAIKDSDVNTRPVAIWIRFSNEDNIAKIIQRMYLQLGRPDHKIINLASVELDKQEVSELQALKTPEYKLYTRNGWERPKDNEEAPTEAYYVNLFRDEPVFMNHRFFELRNAYNILVKAGIIEDLPIVGIPASQKHRIKAYPEWINFEDTILQNIEHLITDEAIAHFLKTYEDENVYEININKLSTLFTNIDREAGSNSKQYDDKVNIVAGIKWDLRNKAKRTDFWELYAYARKKNELDRKERHRSRSARNEIETISALVSESMIQTAAGTKFADVKDRVSYINSKIDECSTKYPLLDYISCTHESIKHVRDYIGMK